MKYVIIGGGPIGGGLGGLLSLAGEEVCLIDHNKENVAAINKDGLRLTIADNRLHTERDAVAKLSAFVSAENVGIADVVVLSTKCCQTRDAAQSIRKVSDGHTTIIVNQNGLGSLDILKEYFPEKQLAYTAVEYGGRRVGPGEIYLIASSGQVNLPVTSVDCSREDVLLLMSKRLATQGFCMTYYSRAQMDHKVWIKLTNNCVLSATCALAHCTIDGFFSCLEGIELAEKIIQENCAVANATGIPLTLADIHSVPTTVQPKIQGGYRHFPSMVADVDRKRVTENAFLNGAVSRIGKAVGVPTPYNDTISALISIVEQNYDCRS